MPTLDGMRRRDGKLALLASLSGTADRSSRARQVELARLVEVGEWLAGAVVAPAGLTAATWVHAVVDGTVAVCGADRPPQIVEPGRCVRTASGHALVAVTDVRLVTVRVDRLDRAVALAPELFRPAPAAAQTAAAASAPATAAPRRRRRLVRAHG
jgi:hypothetical protein